MSKGTKVRSVRVDDETWAAAEVEAKRQGVSVSDLIRAALRQAVAGAAFTALLLLAILTGTDGTVSLDTNVTPETVAAAKADNLAAFVTMLDEQVAEQTAGRDCWKPGTRPDTIPTTILVRGQSARNEAGVVREVAFTDGWKQAEDGDVWVLRSCK